MSLSADNIKRISPVLTKNNFDAWEQATLNYLYAKGWEAMYATSFVNPKDAAADAAAAAADTDDDESKTEAISARADNIAESDRRSAWGAITSSLSNRFLLETRKIKLGEVEDLLRALRGRFYRDSTVTKEHLKTKLRDIHLENHKSLDSFLDTFDVLVSRLEELGVDFDADEQRSMLFKGLTPEYQPIINHFNLQEKAPSTAFIINKLRDYEAANLPHGRNNRGSEQSYGTVSISNGSSGGSSKSNVPCRDHTRGKCRRGNRCRFLHVQRPNSNSSSTSNNRPHCSHCNKQGHVADKCWLLHPNLRPSSNNANKQVKFADHNNFHVLSDSSENSQDQANEPASHTEFAYICNDTVPAESYAASDQTPRNVWLFDGGSTCAITYDRSNCTNIRPSKAIITVGGGHQFESHEVGLRRFVVETSKGLRSFSVDNIRICPEFKKNILPEACFLKKQCTITKRNSKAFVQLHNSKTNAITALVCEAEQNPTSGLFYITESHKSINTSPKNASDSSSSLNQNEDTSSIKDDTHQSNKRRGDPKQSKSKKQKSETSNVPADTTRKTYYAIRTTQRKGCQAHQTAHQEAHDRRQERRQIQFIKTGLYQKLLERHPRHFTQQPARDANIDASSTSATCPTNDFAENGTLQAPSNYHDVPDDDPNQEAATRDDQHCQEANATQSSPSAVVDLNLWHRRFGHTSYRNVARILGQQPPAKIPVCAPCIEGKSHRHPRGAAKTTGPLFPAPRPAHTFHTDMVGKFRTPTKEGHHYLALLVDGYSKMLFAFLMHRKSDFPAIFKEFLSWLQAHFARSNVVAQLVSDGAKTFVHALDEICRTHGIYQAFSPPYEQCFNGTAERNIRTLIEMTRTMLIEAGTPRFLFGYAIKYATYIINRMPTQYPDGGWMTRLHKWSGLPQPHTHSRIRVWGCAAWPLDLGPTRDKLDPKAAIHLFLGVDVRYNCYLLATLFFFFLVCGALLARGSKTPFFLFIS